MDGINACNNNVENSCNISDEQNDLNTSSEESVFNSTQDILIKGLVPKSEHLYEDIKCMVQCVQANKRSDKIKKLDNESFRFDVYCRNQSGFSTLFPICWALALEKYTLKTQGVSCRWVHKYDKCNTKFCNSEILLYFNTTNWVNIIINYTQGFFMVKGALFKKWIDEEFPEVCKEFTPVIPPDGSVSIYTPQHTSSSNDIPDVMCGDLVFHIPTSAITSDATREDTATTMLIPSNPVSCASLDHNKALENPGNAEFLFPIPSADITPLEGNGSKTTSSIINPSNDLPVSPPEVSRTESDRHSVAANNPSKMEKISVFPSEKELDVMWQKVDENGTALTAQDSVIRQIINRCQAIELKVNTLNIQDLIFNVERKFDEKLTAFFTLCSDEMDKKLEGVDKTFTSKIADTHSRIDKLQSRIQTKMDNSIQTQRIPATDSLSDKLSSDLEKINSNLTASIKSTEQELNSKINKLEADINNHGKNLLGIQETIKGLQARLYGGARPRNETNSSDPTPKECTTELLICFDSNRKSLEWDKLWKVKGTRYENTGHLYDVSKVIESTKSGEKVQHILIHVGVNDLDCKDHHQVFDEMKQLLDQIRQNHNGIKMVVSEATPRKDERDGEVKAYNELLKAYASNHADITISYHKNLRDPSWSMYRDVKHIKGEKVAKFAANLIFALKKSYGISSKRELYATQNRANTSQPPSSNVAPPSNAWNGVNFNQVSHRPQPRPLMGIPPIPPTIPREFEMKDRLKQLANYGSHQQNQFELLKNSLQRNLEKAIALSFERG